MNVLVTGGAGFIGSHLSEKLLDSGARVTALDDLSTGSFKNIRGLMERDGFAFVEGDVLDMGLLEELVKKSDLVCHLAAAVGVRYVIENPIKSIEINVNGTENVLKLADKYGKKVFLASTSEVYGKTENRAFSEGDDRLVGSTGVSRWSYSCSKALDEFLAMAYFKERGLPVVIGRFFNTCGPRQTGKYGMVIPRFVSLALRNKPLTVHGDGRQTRSFCYVGDAVRAVFMLISEKKAEGEIFNIGSPEAVTIEALARRVIGLSGSGSRIEHVPYEEAFDRDFEDMRYRVPDISKLSALTGYSPEFTLDMILSQVIDYFREEEL